jgi:hypothetical protein
MVSSGDVTRRPPAPLESYESVEITGFFDIVDTDRVGGVAAIVLGFEAPFENGVGLPFSAKACKVGGYPRRTRLGLIEALRNQNTQQCLSRNV